MRFGEILSHTVQNLTLHQPEGEQLLPGSCRCVLDGENRTTQNSWKVWQLLPHNTEVLLFQHISSLHTLSISSVCSKSSSVLLALPSLCPSGCWGQWGQNHGIMESFRMENPCKVTEPKH